MKKIFNVTGIFALLAIMTLGVASCKQKDEPTNQTTNQQTTQPANQQTGTEEPTIVGTWEVIMIEEHDKDGTGSTDSYAPEDDLTFNKDNSGVWNHEGTLYKFTYTLVGKSLIIKIEENIVYKFDIKELTKDVLVIRVTDGNYWEEWTCKRIK